jgi:hypothetical protein
VGEGLGEGLGSAHSGGYSDQRDGNGEEGEREGGGGKSEKDEEKLVASALQQLQDTNLPTIRVPSEVEAETEGSGPPSKRTRTGSHESRSSAGGSSTSSSRTTEDEGEKEMGRGQGLEGANLCQAGSEESPLKRRSGSMPGLGHAHQNISDFSAIPSISVATFASSVPKVRKQKRAE